MTRHLPIALLVGLVGLVLAPLAEGQIAIAPADPGPAARFLAGLEAGDSPAGEQHAAALEEAFAALEERHLGPMRSWARDTLHPELSEDAAPLLYPFGGPDLITALALYPDAPTWTLIGLEPPGRVRDPFLMSDGELASELPRVRAALAPIVDSGYFVKKWMEDSLASEAFPGVLPILLVFLARDGQTPLSVEPVGLDDEGRLETAPPGDGVRIRARAADGSEKTIVYLRQDLGDAPLDEAPGFLAHLDRLAPYDAWIKAGHYLLHEPGFGRFRDLLLEGSRSLLQDDSAVPWRHLDPTRWTRTLFGEYDRVLPSYTQYLQPELVAAYAAEDHVSPLTFDIGYHARLGGGPLILAVRKGDGTTR